MNTAKGIITDYSPEYKRALEAKFERIWEPAVTGLDRLVSNAEKNFMREYAENSSALRHMFKIIGKDYCPTECEMPCCNGAPFYLGANDLLVRLQKTEGNVQPKLTLESLEDCYQPCEYNLNGCQLDMTSSTRCLGYLCGGLVNHYKNMHDLGKELVQELGTLKDLWIGEDNSIIILKAMTDSLEIGSEIIYHKKKDQANLQ